MLKASHNEWLTTCVDIFSTSNKMEKVLDISR